ncbi:hypothetical protein [Exiguobacterium sp.]|uniref:hypothetical protein n=1 Tax=Exiguobacterium sp. TaxID=44751 RepID=UPI0028AF6CBA|nr:hypothetical protein [Exiguobacterium sp.]
MKKVLKWVLISFGILFIGIVGLGILTSDEDAPDAVKEEASAETENTSKTEPKDKAKLKQESSDTTYVDYLKSVVPRMTEDNLELSTKSYSFIEKNQKLFPAFKEEDINKAKQMTDSTINVKLLNKNVEPYLEKMLSFEGNVVTIEETSVPNSKDVMSLVHVIDDSGDSYQVLLFKTSGDILEEDRVQFWGAPIGPSYFENVSGGTTNVQVFAGSHIEKKL